MTHTCSDKEACTQKIRLCIKRIELFHDLCSKLRFLRGCHSVYSTLIIVIISVFTESNIGNNCCYEPFFNYFKERIPHNTKGLLETGWQTSELSYQKCRSFRCKVPHFSCQNSVHFFGIGESKIRKSRLHSISEGGIILHCQHESHCKQTIIVVDESAFHHHFLKILFGELALIT